MRRRSNTARKVGRGIVSTVASAALALALVPAVAFAEGEGGDGAGDAGTEQTYRDEKYESGKWKTVYIDGTNTSGAETSTYDGATEDVQMEAELKEALKNAGTSEAEKTTILLTKDVQLSTQTAKDSMTGVIDIANAVHVEITSSDDNAKALKSGGVTGRQSKDSAGNYTVSISAGAKINFNKVLLKGTGTPKEGDDSLDDFGNQKITVGNRCAGIFINHKDAYVKLGEGAQITDFGFKNADCTHGIGACVTNGVLELGRGSLVAGCTSTLSSEVINGLGVYVGGSASKLVMNGGEISKNMRTAKIDRYTRGGGVCVMNGGAFEMNSGKISGNQIIGCGAGVHLGSTAVIGSANNAEVAEISGNKAYDFYKKGTSSYNNPLTPQGGGIYYYGAFTNSLTLNNSALIQNNVVQSSMCTYVDASPNGRSPVGHGSGAGIYVCDSQQFNGKGATVEMNGGTIKDNEIQATVVPDANDDNVKYPLAYANGGGVYLEGGTFNMKGGSIEANEASAAWADNKLAGNGGGVYAGFKAQSSGNTNTYVPAQFIMTGGELQANTATGKGDGVYLGTSDTTYSSTKSGTTVTPGVYATRACNPVVAFGKPDTESAPKVSDGVYLPAEAVDSVSESAVKAHMSVGGKLAEESSIVFDSTQKEAETTLVATPLDEEAYAIHLSDAKAFKHVDESYVVGKNDVGNLVLFEKSSVVTKTDISAATVGLEGVTDGKVPYAGKKITPAVKVTLNGDTLTERTKNEDGSYVADGGDYVVRYTNNLNVGTATVTVQGVGNYEGDVDTTFQIEQLDLNDPSIVVEGVADSVYTGKAITFSGLALKVGDTTLKEYSSIATRAEHTVYDYTTPLYANNTEVSTDESKATITITAGTDSKSNVKGTRTVTFSIVSYTEDTFKAAFEAGGNVTFPADMQLQATYTVPEGKTVTLGSIAAADKHKITVGTENFQTADGVTTALFTVPSGTTMVLQNVDIDGASLSRLFNVEEGGMLTVGNGCTLSGGRATDSADVDEKFGGQVIYNAGTLNLNGAISGSETPNNVYGAVCNSSTMTVSSTGVISGIKMKNYGALYNAAAGTLSMNGGKINGCTVSDQGSNGKALWNAGKATLTNNATISNNTGWGSTVVNEGELSMLAAAIKENENTSTTVGARQRGGTVVQQGDNASLTMKPANGKTAEISNNAVVLNGGGVFLAGGTFTIDSDGGTAKISDNTAKATANSTRRDGNGGGIYVAGGTLNILQTKGTVEISGNEAYQQLSDGSKVAHNDNVYANSTNKNDDGSIKPIVYSDSTGQLGAGRTGRYIGLGAAIFVDNGTLKLNGGTVKDNVSQLPYASGIYVCDGLSSGVASANSTFEMSGAPVVSDTIYLGSKKSVQVTGKLTGSGYTLYQQQSDFRLPTSGGSAAVKFADEPVEDADFMDAGDENVPGTGDAAKFKVYGYQSYDFTPDPKLAYEVLASDRAIYPMKHIALDSEDVSFSFDTHDAQGELSAYVYTGKKVAPTVSLAAKSKLEDGEHLKDADGKEVLDTASTNDVLSYEYAEGEGTAVGTVNITVSSNSPVFTGTKTLQFAITPADLSKAQNITGEEYALKHASIVLSQDSYTYEHGKVVESKPDVTVQVDGSFVNPRTPTVLEEGKDYTVAYADNAKAGTAKVTVTGMGNYTGSISKTFTITEKAAPGSSSGGQTASGPTAGEKINAGGATVTVGKDGTGTYTVAPAKAANVTIPDTVTDKAGNKIPVTAVAADAFAASKATLKSVNLGNVTAIPAKAFKGFSKLSKVTGGANVTAIGANAFDGCKALKSFTIGKKVKKVGAKAFNKCKKLKKLTCKSSLLTAKSKVKNALKGSSVKTVKLSGVSKKAKKKVKKAFQKAGKKGVKVK